MAHGLPRMAADEVERTVMRAAQLVMLELLVRFESEVAIGIEHQLDALTQFFLAQEKRIGRGPGFNHVGRQSEG